MPISRALLNTGSPCGLVRRTFHSHHFLLIFRRGSVRCAIMISHPELELYPSSFCFLSLAYIPDSLVGAGRRPAQRSQPPPPKSDRTERSQLWSWVCHENSKLLFSAQNAFEHMKALTVFNPNKLLGAQLGNCSTA